MKTLSLNSHNSTHSFAPWKLSEQFTSPALVLFFALLMAAVTWVWFDQGIVVAWHAYVDGTISAKVASGITLCMLVICAGHAWLFQRAYRWLVR